MTDSMLNALIEVHRSCWSRLVEAEATFDEENAAFKPLHPDTLVPGLSGAFSFSLGRTEICGLIAQDAEETRVRISRDLGKGAVESAEIASMTKRIDVEMQKRISDVHAIFDREETRRADSTLGIAERAYDVAYAAEGDAWDALLAFLCRSPEDSLAKSSYILGCARVREVGFDAEEAQVLEGTLLAG